MSSFECHDDCPPDECIVSSCDGTNCRKSCCTAHIISAAPHEPKQRPVWDACDEKASEICNYLDVSHIAYRMVVADMIRSMIEPYKTAIEASKISMFKSPEPIDPGDVELRLSAIQKIQDLELL